MLVNSYIQLSNLKTSNYKLNTYTNINLPSIKNLPLPNLTQIKLPPIKHHTLLESQELRFKCSKCSKSFKRKNSLIRHERIHTGIKPFWCKVCDKKFTRNDILESHRLSMKCMRKTQIALNNKFEESNLTQIQDNSLSSSPEDSRRTSIASLLWINESNEYDTSINYWLPSPTQSNSSQNYTNY